MGSPGDFLFWLCTAPGFVSAALGCSMNGLSKASSGPGQIQLRLLSAASGSASGTGFAQTLRDGCGGLEGRETMIRVLVRLSRALGWVLRMAQRSCSRCCRWGSLGVERQSWSDGGSSPPWSAMSAPTVAFSSVSFLLDLPRASITGEFLPGSDTFRLRKVSRAGKSSD